MRDILFRGFHECENGKQKAFYNCEWHKGEWVYGKSILYLKENGGEYYMPKCDEKCKTIHLENGDIEEINCADYNTAFYKVAPETVCQYTGRDDMYGKKIFENDVCNNGRYFSTVEYGWGCGNVFGFMCKNLYESRLLLKIIGNKFENPELVEVLDNDN